MVALFRRCTYCGKLIWPWQSVGWHVGWSRPYFYHSGCVSSHAR